MDRIRQAARANSDLFGEHKAENADMEAFMALIEEGREGMLGNTGRKGGKLSQAVQAFVDKIDYWGYLVAEYASKDQAENNAAKWKYLNIQRLLTAMAEWENDEDTEDAGLYAYLNRISLITRDDGDDEDDSKASLMTIHAAKGLEFPVVFIAGVEEGLIPHARALAEDTEGEESFAAPKSDSSPPAGEVGWGVNKALEEERRLFYVALTRAQDKLYLSAARKRRRGQMEETSPSPFLSEIPEQLLEYGEKEEEAPLEQGDMEDAFARFREKLAM
jgi:DNA helicase-2/ATP-dependent DNA helicase PcrA